MIRIGRTKKPDYVVFETIAGILYIVVCILTLYRIQIMEYYYNITNEQALGWSSVIMSLAMIPVALGYYELYCHRRRGRRFVTTGVYSILRHPIYLGVAGAGIPYWFLLPWQYFPSGLAIIIATILACRLEEAAMIKRWGKQAIDYYVSVPRFIF